MAETQFNSTLGRFSLNWAIDGTKLSPTFWANEMPKVGSPGPTKFGEEEGNKRLLGNTKMNNAIKWPLASIETK